MRLRLFVTLVALTILPALPAEAQSTADWLDRSFGGDGTVTTAIGSGHENVRAVAIQADGKIVVAGYSHNGTDYDFAVVRYTAAGALDASFGSNGTVTTAIGSSDAHIHGMALQPDGKIVVVGHSHAESGDDMAVARYNPDGTLDASFGSNGTVTTAIGSGYAYGFAAAVQAADGKIVVAGTGSGGTNYDMAVARYNPDGTLDASFGSNGTVTTAIGASNDQGQAMALQPDGKIVVAGYSFIGTSEDFAVVRYNPDGSLDASFGSNGTVTTAIGSGEDRGYAVAIQADGKIVVTGRSHNGTDYDFAAARYNPDGSLDASFGNGGTVTDRHRLRRLRLCGGVAAGREDRGGRVQLRRDPPRCGDGAVQPGRFAGRLIRQRRQAHHRHRLRRPSLRGGVPVRTGRSWWPGTASSAATSMSR